MSEGITHHTFKAGALVVMVKYCDATDLYFIHYGHAKTSVLAGPKLTSIIELEKLALKELISDMEISIRLLKPHLEDREKASTTATNIEVTP